MLSVGSRDGRKGIGGFDVGREMEENELEEGEACYYQEDDDAGFDPTTSFSYIDEKLQHVLGHFQKDFEGGVSAENLGAKFGGYGSFLPTYQRSPSIWSQPRSPPKVQTYNASKSPNTLPLEGGLQNHPNVASGSHSIRLASVSESVQSSSTLPFLDSSSKKGSTPKHEIVTNTSVNATEQKMLKLRFKVGSNKVSNRDNAEIYSGLGLISPSSLDDSPDGSEGLSPEFHDAPNESPTTILLNMMSFPVPGESFISPLPDCLLCLSEKEKPPLSDSKPENFWKGCQVISTMLPNESLTASDVKGFGEKKTKSSEKSGRPTELKTSNGKASGSNVSNLLTKETETENSLGRKLTSNALKLPLSSSSKGNNDKAERLIDSDMVRGSYRASDFSRDVNTDVVKDCAFSSVSLKEEVFELVTGDDPSKVSNFGIESVPLKDMPTVKSEKRTSSQTDVSLDLRKDCRAKNEKNSNTGKVDSGGFKERKDMENGSVEAPEQKVTQKATSHEKDMVKTSQGKEGKKKKTKGNQINGVLPVEFPKENSKLVPSAAAAKDKKKNLQAQDSFSENKSAAKTIGRESHRESLGDSKFQQVDNRIDSLEISSKDKLKDSKPESEKETRPFVEKSKENYGAKKIENPSSSEAYAKVPATTFAGSGPITDAAGAPAAPVVIEEWVCCDKCQKWRLLPFGMNPNHLPKKWLCSMLNWLPGMNKCTFSEEETTKALNALYQIPVPESQNGLRSQYEGVAHGMMLADVHHPNQSHEHGLHDMPSTVRKKHGLKETPNAALGHLTPTHLPSSIKNQQASVKSRSLTDVKLYQLESNSDRSTLPDTNKSTDFAMEKHRRKQKEKHKLFDGHLDGGDYAQQIGRHSKSKSKSKSKRVNDKENGFRTSKKIKTEASHRNGEDWQSDCDVTRKEILNSKVDLLDEVTGQDPQKHSVYSFSKDLEGDVKDISLASGKKPKAKSQVPLDGDYKTQFVASDMGRSDKMDFATKKRKLKEWQESQGHTETLLNSRQLPSSVKGEISKTELRREKKLTPSKSEGKESSTSDGRIERKGGVTKILLSSGRDPPADIVEEESNRNQGNLVLERALDGIDSSKKEPGYVAQTSTAATSSSSKVSGSRRSKTNFQGAKDSPVESVSSSPLRGSNIDKRMTAKRNILGKDDATNLSFSVTNGSPRRCSDGEDDGRSDQSRTVRTEKDSTVQHGSLQSHRAADSSLVYEHRDGDANQISSGKLKDRMLSKKFPGTHGNLSFELENVKMVNGGVDISDQHNPYLNEVQGMECDTEKPNDHYHANGSDQSNLKKGPNSLLRGKHSKSDFDKDNVKVSDSWSEQEELYHTNSAGVCQVEVDIGSCDRSPCPQDMRNGKNGIQEKHRVKSTRDEKNYLGKHDPVAKRTSESQLDYHSNSVMQDTPLLIKQHTDLSSRSRKLSAHNKDGKSNLQQSIPQAIPREDQRPSDLLLSDRVDRAEMTSGRGKSQPFQSSVDKQEPEGRCSLPVPRHHKEKKADVLPVDASGTDPLKVPKHPNGTQNNRLRKPIPNGPVGRDLDAHGPGIKDYGQVAVKVLKEAKDLKHTANRVKRGGGGELESTNLYFRAALKFLHGASLLEPGNAESAKHGETTQSMQYYTDTASLCEFCAYEYERCKEMAAAALAYKCVEVAYMRVIYSKHPCASKDQCKLQKALKKVLPDESPSSSASDVDDLNNQASLDKGALGKGITSPQIVGKHVISARNRPNYTRMLNYVHDMNSAMEASRKSWNAFSAAKVGLKEAPYGQEDLASVRSALDFNFHDVEGLIHIVRLAMEAIRC